MLKFSTIAIIREYVSGFVKSIVDVAKKNSMDPITV